MNLDKQHPRVGIGIMIFRDGKVLMGKRKSDLGLGDWAFPGGHLENGESLIECAIRETREETGIEITNINLLLLGNIPSTYASHYVAVGFSADWKSGEPAVLEPTKCERWEWCNLSNLPEPLFLPTKMIIDAYQSGKIFWDSGT